MKSIREASGDRKRRIVRRLLPWAAIFVVTLLVYWPALDGELLWDDPAHVTRAELRGWDGLARIWLEIGATQEYYPVLHTAFWIEHRLWGDSTVGYHVLNVLLHAGNCCLLVVVLRKILRMPAASGKPSWMISGGAWLAGWLFAVHPVCVESVAWITEQKNTLSTFCYLLAACAYLEFFTQRRWSIYGVASGLFFLALGAKTMTVTLPAALLVIIWWRQGRLDWQRDVQPLLPWFVVAVAAGLVTSHVERNWVGADGGEYELSLVERVMLAGRIFWFSLGKVLWPADLTFFYPRWDVPAQAGGWIGYAFAIAGVSWALWACRVKSRAPLAAWLLYGGTLFPVLGFFNIFSFAFSYVADHYQYLAVPVVLGAFATGCFSGLARIPVRWRAAGLASLGLVVVGLAVASRGLSRLYQDNETLFRANIAANPESWMGHHILAHTLANKATENRDLAIALYRRALKLKDNPDSHYKLGYMLAQRRDTWDEAIAHYREALRMRPRFPEAHNSLGVELVRAGRVEEAIEHYRTALELRPDFVFVRANLAQALARLPERQAEALTEFEKVLEAAPNHSSAHFHLANLLASIPGREAEAILHYESALRGRPDAPEAHLQLANVLLRQPDRWPEAVTHYALAVELRPDSAELHTFLANALALRPERRAEAIGHYETALRLEPAFARAHYGLASCLAADGSRQEDAIAHVREALRLEPGYVEAHNLLGVLEARRGNLERARSHWRDALRLDPEYAPAGRNLRRLEAVKTP